MRERPGSCGLDRNSLTARSRARLAHEDGNPNLTTYTKKVAPPFLVLCEAVEAEKHLYPV
jgi:hypothetical protein